MGKTLADFFIELEKENEGTRKYSAKSVRKQLKVENSDGVVNNEMSKKTVITIGTS